MALALAAFAVFAWFFTDLHRVIGVVSPRHVFGSLPAEYFSNGHFVSFLAAGRGVGIDPERSVRLLLALLAGAFACVYLAPLPFKRPLIVGWFILGAALLFGALPVAGLLSIHLLLYPVFHPRGPGAKWIAGAGGAIATALVWIGGSSGAPAIATGLAAGAVVGLALTVIYARWFQDFLLRPGPGRVARLLAMYLPLVLLSFGTLWGGVVGTPIVAPLGLTLFFWHYMRILMYGVDVEDGLVPEELPLPIYLSIFCSPAMINSWPEEVAVAQGYSYQTDRFLSREKNQVVLRGLGLMGIALAYMALGPFVIASLVGVAGLLDITAYYGIPVLLDRHLVARDAASSTVLVTSLLDHLKWIFTLGGIFHFKVAVWRLLGYDLDPYLRFPLLATNMVTLWGRLTFYYKEVLVRGFYYPVFLRLRRWPLWARTLTATVFAAGVANWLWAHVTELLIFNGMSTNSLAKAFQLWPYFVLLASGIGIAQLWVIRRGRRRKPWTLDRWLVTDVLAAYVTTQFYALIHVFIYGQYASFGTPGDYWVIFLRAFGLA